MTKVVFIPGIKGSQLFEGKHKRWYPSNEKDLVALLPENHLDPGEPVGRITIPDLLRDLNIYEGILEYLKKYDVAPFTYDWRKSIFDHLDNLNVLLNTFNEKVTIIAHSMGGMIAKAYLLKFGNSKVEQLITIGTPWRGAPDAFKALILGEPLISEEDNRYQIFNLKRDDFAKNLSRNIPSTFELLPSEEYYNSDGGKFYQNFLGKRATWQEILKRLQLQGTNLNFNNNSLPVHNEMLKPLSIKHHALIGYGKGTLKSIPERTSFRLDKGFASFWNGDGVVPFISSIPPHAADEYYVKGEHKLLCSIPETISWIEWILNGGKNDMPSSITRQMPATKMKSTIVTRILCPVGVTLRDQNGDSILGDLDPESTDLSKVSYSNDTYIYTVGDAKYVFVEEEKLEKNYTLEIDSYAKGLANISVINYEQETEDELINFKSISIDEGTVLELHLSESSDNIDLDVKDSENAAHRIEKRVLKKNLEFEDITLQPAIDNPFTFEIEPSEGTIKRPTQVPVYSGDINLKINYDSEVVSEIFWILNDGKAYEYTEAVDIESPNGNNTLTLIARDINGNAFPSQTYEYIVELGTLFTIPILEYNPEYGLGISLKVADNYAGVKESKYRIKKHNDRYTEWQITSPKNLNYHSIESIFGVASGNAILEYQSIDKLKREEPIKELKISIGNLREIIWNEEPSAITPLSLWKNVLPENSLNIDNVTLILKNKANLPINTEIPDNAREVFYETDKVDLRIKFMEQYTLYWSGPPTEVVKRGEAYQFSFQLLTDHTVAITETNPEVVYFRLNPQGKREDGGTRVDLKLEGNKFLGSITVDSNYKGNKIKIRVTDERNTNPPLRETILIIEN